MKTRLFLSSLLLSLGVTACAPASRQPVFSTGIDPAATSLPTATSGNVIATLSQRIISFDVSPDARVLALGTSAGVWLYDLHTRKYLRTLNAGELASVVAWSPNGSKLAVGSTKDYGTPFYQGGDSSNSNKAHLTVWDTATWTSVFEPDFGLEMVNEMFRDLAWSANSRSLAFSLDLGGVQVWDIQSGHVISRQGNFAGTVVDISWSPDGSRLVATGDMAYGIRRWRISDNEAVRLFDKRVSNSMQVAWSPDGKRIASGHYLGGVCFWTAATNKCDGFIQAHRTATFSLAWSPDGTQLATGGGLIRVWDTNTGKLVKAFGQDDRYTYTRIEWPAMAGPIVTLQTGLEDPRDTVLRLWDIESGSVLMEFRGKQQAE